MGYLEIGTPKWSGHSVILSQWKETQIRLDIR